MSLTNREIFAKNLNHYAKASRKTQKDICEDLNLTPSTVSDWFLGKKYPRINTIQVLADYFNIKKSQLIEDHDFEFLILEESNSIYLSADEEELISVYRNLSKQNKFRVIGYIKGVKDAESSLKNE